MITNYKELAKIDVISKLKPALDKGQLYIRNDGRLTSDTRLPHESPWIHIKQAKNRNCGQYHMYNNYFGFVHSVCQECWKVVVRPRTLVELHKLLELEIRLDLPSKCGLELRDSVCGLYGGYFYNDSLEKGLVCWKLIRNEVDIHISSGVDVILKRGCTEFEIGEGKIPSDQWEVSDDQKEMEYLLMDIMDQNVPKIPQPEHVKQSIFRSWIHYAYKNGDMTYLEYTDGKPLLPKYVVYHEDKGVKDS